MSHQPLVAKQPGEAGKGVRIPRSPSVGIGFKIIICLAVVGVLPLFMVQVYTSKITTSALIQSYIEPLGTQTRRLAQRIQNFIDTARADVGFLGRLPLAAGVAGMDAEQVRRFDPQVMAPLTRLQGLFWEFGVAKPYYARLRYLDEHGREVTRVEFGNGMAQAAAPGLLEDLSEDACVRRAAELKPGQVTVCRFSNDKVSWRTDPPNEPMIRVFTAVFAEDGTRRGLVEGSVAGHFVLDELAEAERANEREIYLADSGGQYLYHHDFRLAWSQSTLTGDFPTLAARMTGAEQGTIQEAEGNAATFAVIRPNPDSTEAWTLVQIIPRTGILESVDQFYQMLTLLVLGALSLSVALGYWVSRNWVIRPLRGVVDAMDRFAMGDFKVRSTLVSGDEIGRLSESFNSMATALKEGWDQLEETIEERTARLRESEERYALAMRATNEGLWDWDIDRNAAYLAPRLLKMLELDGAKVPPTPQEWVHHIHPDDRERYTLAMREHLRGAAEFFECEYRLPRADGLMWVRHCGVARRDEKGWAHRMVGSLADISRRKRDEEELRLAASVFANSLQAIIVTDAQSRILDVNDTFVEVTGYCRAEVLGQTPHLLSSGVHDRSFYDRMWHDLAEKGHWAGEVINRRKNGEIYPEWLEINAIRDDSGNVVNYTAMFTDITERRLTEANLELSARQVAEKNVLLNAALARANEANRAKSEFLANMSHELRTPLNAIIGFSEIMSQEMFGPLGNPQYVEYSQHIQDSGVHLLAVINDILDISKIEAGEVTLEDDDVDLSSLIDETVRLVSQRAERARQILDIRVEQGLPHLRGDARRVKQALLNIISNAVKFTPDGGRIAVDARCAHDGGLLVAVEDTGIGIAKDDIAKALAPFGQVDSRLQRKYEGTGLGLAITKHFVEMHEGVLSLESEVGVGTVVTVHFPPSRALDPRPVAVD